MKHTPGPWKNEDPHIIPAPGIGYAICEMNELPEFHEEEAATNARLIAAAPELVAALQHFITVVPLVGVVMLAYENAINLLNRINFGSNAATPCKHCGSHIFWGKIKLPRLDAVDPTSMFCGECGESTNE
jgi:hypothetical protein